MDGMGEGEVAGRGYDYGRGEEARSISSSMAHFLLLPPFAIFFNFFLEISFLSRPLANTSLVPKLILRNTPPGLKY
jgi:hypothetical protein